MIRAHVAQERNTRSAADFTKHSYRGLHRMLTFQPTFAATIALVAAFTAYWGATSKVRYDRQASERDLLRQKLSLFLRLRYRVEIIADAATANTLGCRPARTPYYSPKRPFLSEPLESANSVRFSKIDRFELLMSFSGKKVGRFFRMGESLQFPSSRS
jgi:hypothetical protein